MKRPHPIRRRTACALSAVATAYLVGCSNQQMAASNPFLAPDRVPPPATRVIAPGTAQPYYPGDPLPATSQVAPQGAPAPAAIVQAPTATIPTAVPAPPAPTPQPLAFSNERTVAIPADNAEMRFPLPAPPPVEQPQAVPQPVAQVAAVAPPAAQVAPAVFNEPVANVPPPTVNGDTGGPWRAPEIGKSTPQVVPAQYTQPQAVQPASQTTQQLQVASPSTGMPTQLKAAPAAPASPSAPVATPPPRMRFPSLLSPSTWFTPQPPAGQQLIGYMVPGPDGQMHMVPVDPMPPSGATQPAASVATSDGFRPRTTAR